MIPAIGYMIAFYVITRMLSVLIGRKKGEEGESAIVRVFAAIAILVAIFGIVALIGGEFNIPNY
jgi:Na+-driven multidrug efflux pump